MGSRIVVRTSVEVNRSPEIVFGYLADVSRHHEWSPKAYRVEGVQRGPVSMGTTFTSYGWVPRDADHRNDVEVTGFDPPRSLALTSTENGEQFYNTFTLTPRGKGTHVERVMDMPRPGGIVGAIMPIFIALVVKPGVNTGLRKFRDNLQMQA
jgi:uncharacterized protein YndB with AHSA1/START domain